MARLRVQHCILNDTTRQYGSHPTSDLLGVDYVHSLPADTEYPRFVPKLELFVRFVFQDRLCGTVRITMTELDDDGDDIRRIYARDFALPLIEDKGVLFIDRSFKLVNLMIPGDATYAIRVMRRSRQAPWMKPYWKTLATEYVLFSRVL